MHGVELKKKIGLPFWRVVHIHVHNIISYLTVNLSKGRNLQARFGTVIKMIHLRILYFSRFYFTFQNDGLYFHLEIHV